ncbi:MAG: hypothetical protein AAFU77_17895 [Myxococcota bacterium]
MSVSLLPCLVLTLAGAEPTPAAVAVYIGTEIEQALPPPSDGAQKVLKRLLGRYPVEEISVERLEQMRSKAEDLEANFNSIDAQITRAATLRAYDTAIRLTPAHVLVATNILLDELMVTEGDAAKNTAQTLLRRFPNAELDPALVRPDKIALVEEVRASNRSFRTGELLIEAASTEVFIDGRRIGQVDGTKRVELPAGDYQVWGTKNGASSFSRKVVVGNAPVKVRIDVEIETRLDPLRGPAFRCQKSCEALFLRLSQLLSVERLVLVRSTADSSAPEAEVFDVRTGERVPVETDAPLALNAWLSDRAPGLAVQTDESGTNTRTWWIVSAVGLAILGGTVAALALRGDGVVDRGTGEGDGNGETPVTVVVELPDASP